MTETTTAKKKALLRITGERINEYLGKSGMNRNSLAKLLNVNPASVTRWIAEKYPQSPTSTTYLALIPLLLSKGVSILPEPPEKDVEDLVTVMRASGMVDEKVLGTPEKLAALRKQVAIRSSVEVQASRRLFLALAQAWRSLGFADDATCQDEQSGGPKKTIRRVRGGARKMKRNG